MEPFVAEKSQEALVSAFWKAMEKMVASTVLVTWRKKGGGTVDSTVILVSMAYAGHLFAVHFVS